MRPEAVDLLREIVNIGASQGSGALAACLDTAVRISVPMFRELELAEAPEIFGPPTEPVEAGLVLVEGTFEAGLLLALSEDDGRSLREALGASADDETALDVILEEVLRAFVDSTAMFLMAELRPELSRRLRDMAGSLVPSLLGELDYEIETLWMVEVDFVAEGRSVVGRLFFLAGPEFYRLVDEMAG